MNPSMKSAVVYAGVLAALMGASWVKYTAEPEPDLEGKVVVVQGEASEITKISWKTEDEEAVIEQRSDDLGSYLWVDYTKWETPTKPHDRDTPPVPEEADHGPDAPDAEGTPAEPAAEEPEPERVASLQVFKAGEAGDKLLESLSPLTALRKLDSIPDDKRETIGLDKPTDFLEISRKGRTTKFALGGEVYGTRDRYLRNEETGEVFLVDDETLRPLKYARTRLPDRALFGLANDKIASGTLVDPAGGSLEFTQKNAQDQAKATWVRADDPDNASEQLKTWVDKALKLKGTKYADPAEPPVDLQLRFSVSIKDAAGKAQTLEVYQEGAEGDWWAKSEYTRGLIKLLKGPTSSLSDDIGAVIEG